ncbi:MAG: hypothetical protein LBJ59_00535 [Zoogloeaceae bacterium]|nr:hypothetical protein [Zoogloeaceae bacterium]
MDSNQLDALRQPLRNVPPHIGTFQVLNRPTGKKGRQMHQAKSIAFSFSLDLIFRRQVNGNYLIKNHLFNKPLILLVKPSNLPAPLPSPFPMCPIYKFRRGYAAPSRGALMRRLPRPSERPNR